MLCMHVCSGVPREKGLRTHKNMITNVSGMALWPTAQLVNPLGSQRGLGFLGACDDVTGVCSLLAQVSW